MGGISFLLVERGPGVTTRHMACQGLWCGGTAYVTFEDAKVDDYELSRLLALPLTRLTHGIVFIS